MDMGYYSKPIRIVSHALHPTKMCIRDSLTDKAIVQRFFDRDEDVLTDVENRYGSYLFTVANNILQNTEDSKECVNDTYLSAWQKIPPHRPPVLLTFLSKITRGHAIDRWRQNRSLKRGGGQYLSLIHI